MLSKSEQREIAWVIGDSYEYWTDLEERLDKEIALILGDANGENTQNE